MKERKDFDWLVEGSPYSQRRTKYRPMYALFTGDVRAIDKYRVTTPPSIFFNTRKEARKYVKKHKMKDTKIMTY